MNRHDQGWRDQQPTERDGSLELAIAGALWIIAILMACL